MRRTELDDDGYGRDSVVKSPPALAHLGGVFFCDEKWLDYLGWIILLYQLPPRLLVLANDSLAPKVL